jgi:hypothetical protein
MYRRFDAIPQVFLLLLLFLFFGDFSEPFLGIFVGRIWRFFFEGFVLGITYEVGVPLFVIIFEGPIRRPERGE